MNVATILRAQEGIDPAAAVGAIRDLARSDAADLLRRADLAGRVDRGLNSPTGVVRGALRSVPGRRRERSRRVRPWLLAVGVGAILVIWARWAYRSAWPALDDVPGLHDDATDVAVEPADRSKDVEPDASEAFIPVSPGLDGGSVDEVVVRQAGVGIGIAPRTS